MQKEVDQVDFKKIFATLLLALALIPFMASQAEAFANEHQVYFHNITLNSSAVNGSHTNFSILLNLSNMPASFWAGLNSTTGADIHIYDQDDATKLDREIVHIDNATQTGELWFRKPTLSGTSFFYIYYGNASNATTNSLNAWGSNYAVINHMSDLPTGQMRDSKNHSRNITTVGSMTASDRVGAKIYNGTDFDGSDDSGEITAFNMPANISMSAWLKPKEVVGGPEWIVGQDSGSQITRTGTQFQFYVLADAALRTSGLGGDLAANETYYIAGTYNGTDIRAYLGYSNGTIALVAKGIYAGSNTGSGNSWFVGGVTGQFHDAVIDEVRQFDNFMTPQRLQTEFNNQNNASKFYSVGNQQQINAAPIVTINSPENISYFMLNNFNISFLANDDNSTVYTINATITYPNSTTAGIYFNSSYNDGSTINFLKNLTSVGQHSITVNATDSDGLSSINTVVFNIDDVESTLVFNSSVLETSTINLTLRYRVNFDLVSSVQSNLTWNGSSEGISQYSMTNSTHINKTQNITVPLIAANNTNVAFFWNSSITYVNGTSVTDNPAANSQNLHFAYFLGANAIVESDTNPVEGDVLTIIFNVTSLLQLATITGNFTYNNTINTMSETNFGNFSNTTFRVPSIDNTTGIALINGTAIITFGSNSRTVISESDTITVNKIILTDCSSISNTTTLEFFLFNEETDAVINGTIEMLHNVSNEDITRVYNFTFTNVTNATICINPAFSSYLLDSWIKYYATGFSTRDYFIFQTISNVTATINLYLLDADSSENVIFIVRDQGNNPITAAIIAIQRFFVGSNTFKTVAQCRSDSPDGKCVAPLRVFDVDYRYIVQENQTTTLTTTPTKIVCQAPYTDSKISIQFCPPYPQILKPREPNEALFLKLTGNFEHACFLNESSSILRCDVIDTTGLMSRSSLIVDRKDAINWTRICWTNETSSTVTHTCNLGNVSSNIFRYQLIGYFSEPGRTFESGIIDKTNGLIALNWGGMGIFLSILLVVGFFMLGRDNPGLSIGLGFVSIIMGYMLKMYAISIAGVFGIAVSTIILIVSMRER